MFCLSTVKCASGVSFSFISTSMQELLAAWLPKGILSRRKREMSQRAGYYVMPKFPVLDLDTAWLRPQLHSLLKNLGFCGAEGGT